MNHPELDICKIIGAEFLDSEFAYWKHWKDSEYGAESRWRIPNDAETIPAPTCEELGAWLKKAHDDYWQNWWHDEKKQKRDIPYHEKSPLEWMRSDNETQARAEAVKMILTNKGE